MPDETRTVEESAFNDVMYEQYEQARARMEGMTRRELRALQGLCHEVSDLAGEVLDEKAVKKAHYPAENR